jgi:hypothetical protein
MPLLQPTPALGRGHALGLGGDLAMTAGRDAGSPIEFARLRSIANDYRLLVLQATQLRERRDSIALALIDAGATWRDVAEAAGFENPYIAELKRKRGSRTP